MSIQRSKAPLALMEQIIMILVFALAAAVCLQAFVFADQLSKEGERRSVAASKVQEVAEFCKAEGGNLEKAAEKFSGKQEADGISVEYGEEGLVLVLRITQTDALMEKAQISVTDQDGEEIYTIPVAWQKGERNE